MIRYAYKPETGNEERRTRKSGKDEREKGREEGSEERREGGEVYAFV